MKKKSAAKGASRARSPSRPIPDRTILDALLEKLEADDATPLERAQDLAWEAWDTGDGRKRVALARKALKISPICADAYVILAEDAKTVEEGLTLCRQGVEAGEKAIGPRAFREDAGHFWGFLETRPYMRARHGLAMRLWKTGEHEQAIAHYRDLLRLNPNDNQGIRYLLLDCLLILGRDEQVEELLRQYRKEGAPAWLWSAALALFRREGDSAAARKAIHGAARGNVHIADYLLRRKPLPRSLPALISCGGEDEAVAYVAESGAQAWAAAPGAIGWLEKMVPGVRPIARLTPRAGRR